MRADTHDGPEQRTLHTEAEYIDAGPFDHHENPSCDARSVHASGSGSEATHCDAEDRFGWEAEIGV